MEKKNSNTKLLYDFVHLNAMPVGTHYSVSINNNNIFIKQNQPFF